MYTEGVDNGKFALNPDTGALVLAQKLDREERDRYHLTVMAEDGGNPPLNSTAIIEIVVQDVNDVTPTFRYDTDCSSLDWQLKWFTDKKFYEM